jgi:hypothetical protein
MTRRLTITATLALAIAMSGAAIAQRGHHQGSSSTGSTGTGRPATTGLEHAETRANSHGDQGIENAEAKQAEHKHKHKKHNKSHKHSQ